VIVDWLRLEPFQKSARESREFVRHRAIAQDKPDRSHDAVIRVCDAAGNVIETHRNKGDFKEP